MWMLRFCHHSLPPSIEENKRSIFKQINEPKMSANFSHHQNQKHYTSLIFFVFFLSYHKKMYSLPPLVFCAFEAILWNSDYTNVTGYHHEAKIK